jgi:sugar phosphate isomerase/epimerase
MTLDQYQTERAEQAVARALQPSQAFPERGLEAPRGAGAPPHHHRLNRRQFVQALGAGVAAVRFAAGEAFHLNIGIGTYSYHGLSMEAMIAQLTQLKIKEIEMSRGEFMLLSHPNDALFTSARALLDKAQIRCVSYYAATVKVDAEIEQAIRFARLLGASNITGDGTPEILKRVDERLTAAKLTFGLHNHYFPEKFAYESPEDLLRTLKGMSKTMGVTLDLGHIASCGYDTVDAVRKLGPYLRLVHLKDVKAAHGEDNVIIGQGIANIPAAMRELRQMHFGGLVAIEYEKEGPVEDDMRRAVEYARRLA